MIGEILGNEITLYTLSGVAVLLVAGAVWYGNRIERKKRVRVALDYRLLRVSQTQHPDGKQSLTDQVAPFEDLINSIVPEKKPVVFEMAVPAEGTDILFFVAVPSESVESVKNQIRRVFERAQVEEVPDYTIFHQGGSDIFYHISLKQFFGLPIHSYKKSNSDTFASVIGAFANVKEPNIGIMFQLILRRAPKNKKEEIKTVLREIKKGKTLKQVRPADAIQHVGNIINTIDTTQKKEEEKDPEVGREAPFLEEKISARLYEVNARIGIAGPSQEVSERLFDSVKEQFDRFAVSDYNYFVFKQRKDKKMTLNITFRIMDKKTAMVLNTEEIASIFHFPTEPIEVSNLHWLKTKRVAAPTEIAKEGILLGDNIFHGQSVEVRIPDSDRLRHLYIVGQTGTGKSATIKSMAYQDIQEGRGVCVIDPHGDLVDDMLGVVPENRIDDVIVFDPSNLKYPLGLNMLEYNPDRPEEKTFIVNEMLSIFNRLFGQSAEAIGPAFQQYMRNTLLLLMEGKMDEPATLMDVPRVFSDDAFRETLLQHCRTEPVRQFWADEVSKVEGDWGLSNIAPYITSKLGGFITNDYVRPIIEQPRSSFSFREIMDSGKLLFVKLPKGKIGEINARLLGMLTTGKIAMAAFSRDDVPEHERRDFYFYIDEFQNFTTDSISQILSEARKYRLGLIVAHQYMAQLTEDIRGAVLGNVGSVIAFRVGIEDAEVLQKKFTPKFSAIELTEIENLNSVVSMLSNEKPLPPFTMKVRFAPRGSHAVKEKIIQYSGLKYGKRTLSV